VADGFDRGGKARAESRKIKRTRTLVDLDGVAATHGDVGLGFAVKVGKFAPNAGAAGRVARDFEGLEAAGPDVGGDKTAMQRVFLSGEKF